MRAALRAMRDRMIAGGEDFDDRIFPDDARRIEDGKSESRAVRGRPTFEQASAPLDDGVEFLPIPVPPRGAG